MNLEEARNNIGAEVELDESTKPYTWIGIDNTHKHDNTSNTEKLNGVLRIESIDYCNNLVITCDNGCRECYSPRHLKLKPQNYKIHVPTGAESKEITWQDALRAVADGKDVEILDSYGNWERIGDFYIDAIASGEFDFRLAPQRITLNGEYTKEELLQKIGEME